MKNKYKYLNWFQLEWEVISHWLPTVQQHVWLSVHWSIRCMLLYKLFLSMFYYMTDVGHFQLLYFYLWQILNIFTSITNRRMPKLYTPICTELFSCHVPQTRTRTAYQRELHIMWLWFKVCLSVQHVSMSETCQCLRLVLVTLNLFHFLKL